MLGPLTAFARLGAAALAIAAINALAESNIEVLELGALCEGRMIGADVRHDFLGL